MSSSDRDTSPLIERGVWSGPAEALRTSPEDWSAILERCESPVYAVWHGGELALASAGTATLGAAGGAKAGGEGGHPLVAYAPALTPESLGDATFRADYRVKYAYVAGEMANGIASVELVVAMARAGMIGFFGAAGLDPATITRSIERIRAALGPDGVYGSNLIHSPHEPALEAATADAYIRLNVPSVCASAYLGLTPAVVRLRCAGLRRGADGEPVPARRMIAKVSRVEVARRFLSPAPEKMLRELVAAGQLTEEEAALAARLPMCDDLTAEADSGGHTDNRPAIALIPTMIALRDELAAEFGYPRPPRVGAAGGIATPASVAGAFALGAAYVVTGSINQACGEAGTSDAVRRMLAAAEQADVMMAPAADMFEMGVNVQVLKRGTLFGVRARRLYELYRAHGSIGELPAAARATLERDYFRTSLEAAWESTRQYFEGRDPGQLARAAREPKHQLALLFRAYLGQASKWANAGEPTRQADYQVWCGPAMGAFNEWARGSFLEAVENRKVATIGLNLMQGAAKLTRAAWLKAQGLRIPPSVERFVPRDIPGGLA
jgi:trans-AT polyketide synthase/acyltransferase/oxidoreductase domain-containing protein